MRITVASAVLSLALALSSHADVACRDFRSYPLGRDYQAIPVSSGVIAVDRNVTATLQWASEPGRDDTQFALKGTLCGPDLEPLAHRAIEIVRIERSDASRVAAGPLSTSEYLSGATRKLERHRIETTEEGNFAVTGLPPGEYAMDVDWDEVQSAAPIVFDVKLLPGYRSFLRSSQASVSDVGAGDEP